jgi:membrane-associated phospholipid phosphatase
VPYPDAHSAPNHVGELRCLEERRGRATTYAWRVIKQALRLIGDVDRRVLRRSIAAAVLCLVTFVALRLVLLQANGPLAFDVWLEDHIRQENASRTLKILEHLASLPGSRKGAMAETVSVGAWAWFRRRDVRPGILLAAAFTGTTATVALLKTFLVRFWPINAAGAEAEERAFVSSHTANAVAVFAMLVVVVALSGRRNLFRLAVVAAGIVAAAVALSVMAADRHYLVDVVSGIAVAGLWVSILVPVGYLMWTRPDLRDRLKREPPQPPYSRFRREATL